MEQLRRVRPQRTDAALALGIVLVLAGVLVGLAPAFGVVRFADGSPVHYASVAAWTAVLPGLLTVVLALVRPLYGLAAAAGAGAIGLTSLLANIALIADPGGATRPELFYETTDRVRPMTAVGGAYLILLADVVTIAIGVVAAVRLTSAMAGDDDGAGASAVTDTMTLPVVVADGFGPGRASRRVRNNPMILVGFLGAVLLLTGGLMLPYTGGYVTLRLFPAGVEMAGVLAAVLLGVIAAAAVVIAGVLPRGMALALLGSVSLAAAVPALTALIAVATAPTGLTASAWITLVGAAILAAAGAMSRIRLIPRPQLDPDGRPASPRFQAITGGLVLLGGLGSLIAYWLPQVLLDGHRDTALVNGHTISSPVSQPWLVAAVPLLVAGVLALVPRTARIGQAAAAVVWAGAAFALTQAVELLSDVKASTENPLNAGLPVHVWTAGPGLWVGFVGALAAAVGAVLAGVAAYRASQAATTVPDDDSLAASRYARSPAALVGSVLAVVAFGLPVYRYLGGESPALFGTWAVDTFGVLLLLLVVLGAMWAGVAGRSAAAVATGAVAAAAMVAVRLVVPSPIRAQPGFGYSVGFVLGIVLVASLLVAAAVFAASVARITMVDVDIPGVRAERPAARGAATGRPARGRRNTARTRR